MTIVPAITYMFGPIYLEADRKNLFHKISKKKSDDAVAGQNKFYAIGLFLLKPHKGRSEIIWFSNSEIAE